MRSAVALICVSSAAFADDLVATEVARARFTTNASSDAVQRASCSLDAHVEVAGQERALDVRVVNGAQVTRCATSQGGLALTVQTTNPRDVNVEVDVPDGAPQETIHELGNLVQAIAVEIKRRASIEKPEAPVAKEAFSPALTATGIAVGVAGIAMLVTGYVWLLGEIDNFNCRNNGNLCIDAGPPALLIIGALALPVAALLAVMGGRRVPARTARLVPWVAPRAVGATAGLSFRF